MATVKQVAQLANVSATTVREWGKTFSHHLSDTANQRPRQYDDNDVAVYVTIKTLRDQGTPFDDINEALNSGARYEPKESPTIGPQVDTDQARALAPYSLVERFMNLYEQSQENLLEAEKRAVAAETKAELLQERVEELTAKKRRWWHFRRD